MNWQVSKTELSRSYNERFQRITDTYQLVEVLPVILSHEPKRAQHRPAEVVKVSETVVRIVARSQTLAVFRTFTTQRQYRIYTQSVHL